MHDYVQHGSVNRTLLSRNGNASACFFNDDNICI